MTKGDNMKIRILVPFVLMLIIVSCGLAQAKWEQKQFIVTMWCQPPVTEENMAILARDHYTLTWVGGLFAQPNPNADLVKELDIATVDVLSVAKEAGRHDRGMTRERVFLPHHKEPIHFDPRSPLLFLIQTMRDEAHRKAITFHRQRRAKQSLASSLDTLPGIGKLVLKNRAARMGRNPKTGETISIPAKRVVKFRVAKAAKDAILGAK